MKKSEKLIYDNCPSNTDFEDWKKDYLERCDDLEMPCDENDEDSLFNKYCEELNDLYWDEETNLNKELNGIIVAFANLGFWNGRRDGAKIFSDNLNSILDVCGCDYIKVYADRYNVRSVLSHHDGTHYLLFRLAPNKEIAELLEYKASMGELTEDYFKRKTKSIRKDVAEVYGW